MDTAPTFDLAPHLIFASLALGYLLGSIPFGLVITRMAGLGDIRKIGSGNIGTTNVLRTGRKSLAAATLLGDALKGTVAVLIAGHFFGPSAAMLAGLAAFIGHIFPVWLGFKGGKGVATYLGILLGLSWQAGIVFALSWILAAYLFRFSSLSALIASLISPIVLVLLGQMQLALVFALLTAFLWAKHHENIRRLLSGTESKIGSKAKAPAAEGADTPS
ncbi:glycerol-3-phosphate 1-O-acyltransferase PlsY [Pannonibacter sp. Q-1]|uniref:Glycerol-3-phosphate acyltransferase n=1 Tax=Pannonibacter phragmitetus TaxID=121719 RepID=A0A0U3PNH0_9HYPH|nr:glycerol-3-phosphate 1-O-acyltransferase PlsY [Pannonibacter phragmitetus]ALV29052.1 glycerol-3-phosphate acyltransferase [Pannonibacter phragmitetus]MBA4207011.1 glycerol-3-phosphate 1-O-acyltransferase PlsY [Polymorphum sp.]